MYDLDGMLRALRDETLPRRLDTIGPTVIEGLSVRHEKEFSRRGLTLAAVLAGFVGLAVGIGSPSPASAEHLLAIPHSAPSNLLAE